ncbi:stage II sporulation protein P [Flavonifractor hominis]|uniref:Stage II sporulation protein P n=1 Tax=Flavonifractor hominis TaxID=3133178 RepID=A0ABV1ER26_9FIRM
MNKQPIQWSRILRRSGALFLVTLAAWLLLLCCGTGTAAGVLQELGEDPDFVTAALAAELGPGATKQDARSELNGWERLVVDQSLLLRSGTWVQTDESEATPDLPAGQPAQDHDDVSTPPPETTAAPEDIVARTLVPTSTQGYEVAGKLYLYNRTGLDVDLAAAAAAPVQITLPEEGPQILIIHTHGSEAYTPDGTDVYVPSDNNSRTLDENYNMVRVGDEMERVFTEMGLTVVHDRTLYDYPQYNGAYDRSAEAVKNYLAQYPSIKIILDVHRDALVGEDGTVYKAVTQIDGVDTAQVMLVLGSSEGGEHPNWTQNLTLACKLQQSMDTLYPTLARPMTMRSSRYNQQLSTGSLLVEVGTHGNTLQEALSAARLFARASGQVLLGLEE